MSYIYTVVDQHGFIAAFDDIEKAKVLLDDFKDIKLLLWKFPLDPKCPINEVFFIPYIDINAVALVTNNPVYAINMQMQLCELNLTYPDPIHFYKRKINHIHQLELKRLTDPDFNKPMESPFDDIKPKTDIELDKTLVMEGGLCYEQYHILDRVYSRLDQKLSSEKEDNVQEEGSSVDPDCPPRYSVSSDNHPQPQEIQNTS